MGFELIFGWNSKGKITHKTHAQNTQKCVTYPIMWEAQVRRGCPWLLPGEHSGVKTEGSIGVNVTRAEGHGEAPLDLKKSTPNWSMLTAKLWKLQKNSDSSRCKGPELDYQNLLIRGEKSLTCSQKQKQNPYFCFLAHFPHCSSKGIIL